MSVRLMSEVWQCPHFNSSEKLLMLAITDHCNDDGVCWPSVERLMKMCGWSSKTFTKYMNILVDAQVIMRQSRASTTEGRKTNLYKVNHSSLYTGTLMDRLRVSRQKHSRSNTKFVHASNNAPIKAFKPHVCTRVHTNHNNPSQDGEYDVLTEAKSIADELDLKGVSK